MPKKFVLSPTNNEQSALLVMDMQNAIVNSIRDHKVLIRNISAAIKAAHHAHIPVIYIMVVFRQGFPEISQNNKSFSMIKHNKQLFVGANAMEIYPEITPHADDIIVTKRRVSAFSGSDLSIVLRSQNINHLILSGIATSGVVLSTVREAADKDYKLSVLSDCCYDNDDEVHHVLLSKVFPRQADVMTGSQWIKLLSR